MRISDWSSDVCSSDLLAVVFAVMARPDMLQHADRDDAVILGVEGAVVAQVELHPVGDAGLLGPQVRHPVLLVREGDAVDGDGGVAVGEEQAAAAPSRPDVEHLVAGLGAQLGRAMPLLVVLRGPQVSAGAPEISPAV